MKSIIKHLFWICSLFFCYPLSAQIDTLLLPYDATTLTEEQKRSNPSVLAYPTSLKTQIPVIRCIYPFTIDDQGHQVEFSPGNLQYQASTGLWRFAEHQWDFVGDATVGTVYEDGVKCDNSLISSTYTGWIDLFAWGTSGWPRKGGEDYEPTDVGMHYAYCHYCYDIWGSGQRSLVGEYAKADWGVYNQIGADAPSTWRTLSDSQWKYITNQRPNAANLHGLGVVNGVRGEILLPDDWKSIEGVVFNPSAVNASENNYSLTEWAQMESHGAVFLPVAGYRKEFQVVTGPGCYWSSTANKSQYHAQGTEKYYVYAYSHYFNGFPAVEFRYYGMSVRLVRDVVK